MTVNRRKAQAGHCQERAASRRARGEASEPEGGNEREIRWRPTNGPGYIRRVFPDPVITRVDGRDIAVEDSGPGPGFPIIIQPCLVLAGPGFGSLSPARL